MKKTQDKTRDVEEALDGNLICHCKEQGVDGTKNHSSWSGKRYISQSWPYSVIPVTPCKNHVKNYIQGNFKEV